MTTLLLVLGIVLLIVGYVIYCIDPDIGYADGEALGWGIGGTGACISVISLIAVICLGISVSQLKVIDDKIEMYQEQNALIEQQIADVVEGYQKYEADIFEKVAPESAVTLVSLYPELKSDTLVQSQIELYTDNIWYINQLKEQQINGDIYRWWLYFGG
jgi:hypothetical protein